MCPFSPCPLRRWCGEIGVMKVAVLGASGIGKNHARWFVKNGAEVVSFLGTSAESVGRTEDLLRDSIGFLGRGFTDFEELIEESRPDAVCISTPNVCHYGQAKTALEHGLAVLCEKPLVHDKAKSDTENIADGAEIVELAEQKTALLGMQTQYVFFAPALCLEAGIEPEAVDEFSMVMETKNVIAGRTFRDVWIDLAPHPLSVLQTIAPGAKLEAGDQEFSLGELRSTACFTLCRPDGRRVRAKVDVGVCPGREPQRRVVLNGTAVEYAGYKDPEGNFWAKLWKEEAEPRLIPDFVDSLVGNFIAAWLGDEKLKADGELGLKNLEWLLRLSS